MAGGSGIAPIVSMIRGLESVKFPHKVSLYYGVRHEPDFCYRDYFESLRDAFPQFSLFLCVSDQSTSGNSGAYSGRVTSVFDEHLPSLVASDFYLCGSPPMVKSAEELLLAKAIDAGRIKKESY
jgi:NAD(P)H-flavin reductase